MKLNPGDTANVQGITVTAHAYIVGACTFCVFYRKCITSNGFICDSLKQSTQIYFKTK